MTTHRVDVDRTGTPTPPADAAGATRPGPPPLLTAAAAVVAALVALVACLTRQPGHPLDNLFAEDGTRFLSDGYHLSLPTALTQAYSGYLHLYPRLAGALAAAAPAADAARVLTGAGVLATVAATAAVVLSARTLVRSLVLRLLTAVAIPLLPNAGSGALANVANAHVWLDLLAAVVLCRPLPVPMTAGTTGTTTDTAGAGPGRRARWWRAAADVASAVAVALAIGSDPLALVLLPAAAGRLLVVAHRARRAADTAAGAGRPRRGGGSGLVAETAPVVVLVVGGAVQLVTAATHRVPSSPVHAAPVTLVRLWLRDVLGSIVLGAQGSLHVHRSTLLLLGLAALAVLALTVMRSPARGLAAAALAAGSFVVWLPPPWLKWTPDLGGADGIAPHDARYTVLAGALALLAGAACVDVLTPRRVPAAAVAVVLGLVAAVTWSPSYHSGPIREPSWSSGVAAARRDCALDPAARVAPVAIAPDPFHISLPCAELR